MTSSSKDKIEDKIIIYKRLLKQDEDGFIESTECDSLLFSALAGCVPGIKVDIDKAFDGKTWQRRQCSNPCFPEHSKSSISRDMLIGLAWFSYYNSRLDISESVINHAIKNHMIMGEGKLSRTIMTPGLLSTYAWISHKLGGKSRSWIRWIPTGVPTGLSGYQAHLAVLHNLLRKELTSSEKYGKMFYSYYEQSKNNPLFAIAAGRHTEAENSLMNGSLWPDQRLPSELDRKPQWLMERDESEWLPSPGIKVHSGADFLFTAWLLEKMR
jgi:hypothetical protein